VQAAVWFLVNVARCQTGSSTKPAATAPAESRVCRPPGRACRKWVEPVQGPIGQASHLVVKGGWPGSGLLWRCRGAGIRCVPAGCASTHQCRWPILAVGDLAFSAASYDHACSALHRLPALGSNASNWVRTGRQHSTITGDGHVYYCSNSIALALACMGGRPDPSSVPLDHGPFIPPTPEQLEVL